MTDGILVRLAVPGDLAALDALYARSYPRLLKPDYPPSVLVTALPLIAKANPRLLRTGTFFVAQDKSGDVLGAGGWTPFSARGMGQIRHFVTDHRHARQGIGRALMETALKSARRAGIAHMECRSTFTAVPFYRALGFSTLGPIEVTLALGITFPAMRMECLLQSDTRKG